MCAGIFQLELRLVSLHGFVVFLRVHRGVISIQVHSKVERIEN